MAYNLADLTSAVQDDLKDPAFSAGRIARYLNRGQDNIFNTHMFKFCEKSVSGSLTVGSYAFDQQSDHQTTIGGVLIDPVTKQFFRLDNDSYLAHRDFFDQFPDPSLNPAGMPSVWTEFGNEIIFNCPLDKAYTLKQRYYREVDDIEDTSNVPTVPKTFRELLENYALSRSEDYRGNHDVAALYMQKFDDGLENMTLRFAEVHQVGPVIMGSSRTRIEL